MFTSMITAKSNEAPHALNDQMFSHGVRIYICRKLAYQSRAASPAAECEPPSQQGGHRVMRHQLTAPRSSLPYYFGKRVRYSIFALSFAETIGH
ncbi:hypothetical protein G7046_g520 [Stylonectria norvegica]|nr:hypothetical protein G7046_g520 [Stylonectria norvegica]